MRVLIVCALIASAWGLPTGKVHDPMINEGLFEGDIMGIDPHADRNAIPRDSQRWPGGILPYVIDSSLDSLKGAIMKAMKEIEDNSCIRFTPRTASHRNFVRLFKGNGCWSYWGLLNWGQQDLSLGTGCEPHGTIVHELLHAIGFEHEHSRSDRDDYLNIIWSNVDESQYHNFKKFKPEENRLLSDFDFDSIMLYGHYTFSKGWGLKAMEAKDGRFMKEVYNKPGMVKSDILRLRKLYECK